MTTNRQRRRQRQRLTRCGLKSSEGCSWIYFFGVLRFAQDDGKKLAAASARVKARIRAKATATVTAGPAAKDDNSDLKAGIRGALETGKRRR